MIVNTDKYLTIIRKDTMLDKIKESSRSMLEKGRNMGIKKPEINITPPPGVVRIIKLLAIFIILAVGVLQIVFGSLIYFSKADDQTTRTVAKYIPFPAVYTSSGIVTTHDYFHEMDYINHFYSATEQTGIDQQALREQIMLQLIENKIIAEEAAKFKIRITNQEIDEVFSTIIEENGGQEEVNKVLNDLYGLNQNEFRRLIQVQLLRDKVNNEALTKVRARHILIRLESDADEAKISEAKIKIEGYLKEINEGLDFSEAANKYSEDVGSNEQGGDLGFFGRGEMIKEFEEVAYETSVSKISNPFKTSFGWHILRVEEKKGEIDKSFEDWMEEIKNKTIIINLLQV